MMRLGRGTYVLSAQKMTTRAEANCVKDAAITEKDVGTTNEDSTPGGTSKREHDEIGESKLHAVSTEDDNKDAKQKKKEKKKKAEENCRKDAAIPKKDVRTAYENSTPGATSKREHDEIWERNLHAVSTEDDSKDAKQKKKRAEKIVIKM